MPWETFLKKENTSDDTIKSHPLYFNDDIKISMPEGDKTLSPSNIEKMDEFIPEWRIILENRPYLYNDILHVFANYGLFEI